MYRFFLPSLLALTPLGCKDNAEDSSAAACSGTDENAAVLFTSLRFGREREDGSAPGFNLDGDVSVLGGSTGCGRPDHVDPEGVEGIDNAFARIVPLLDQTEAVAVEGIVLDHIESGALLLLTMAGYPFVGAATSISTAPIVIMDNTRISPRPPQPRRTAFASTSRHRRLLRNVLRPR